MLAGVRQGIDALATLVARDRTAPRLLGRVEVAGPADLAGWVIDVAQPLDPVTLDIFVDGAPVGQAMANIYRPDLETAGVGNGQCAFAFAFNPPLDDSARRVVEVRLAGAAVHVVNSPIVLEAAVPLGSAVVPLSGLLGMIARSGDAAAIDTTMSFLMAQGEAVIRARAQELAPVPAGHGRKV